MSNQRQCIGPGCRTVIHECSGFVLARDFLAVLEGTRTETPRELCKNCAVIQNWPEYLGIPKGPHYEGVKRLM